MKQEIVLVDLFAGIGGFHKAMMEAGIPITKCYFSEINKFSISNYKYNFPNAEFIGDVRFVRAERIREAHPSARIIVTFGWPCQDNSIAGKRKGQNGDTRSGLLFQAGRIIKEVGADNFLAENVKGLYSVNDGIDFRNTLDFLSYLDTDDFQYHVEQQLFNTVFFLPQNRERTYFVGHSASSGRSIKRIFPFTENDTKIIELQGQQGISCTITGRLEADANGSYIIERKQLPQNAVALTETRNEESKIIRKKIKKETGKDFSPRRGKDLKFRPDENANTVTATQGIEQTIFVNDEIRRYTPIEVERLQGYPDLWTEKGMFIEGTEYWEYKGKSKKLIKKLITKKESGVKTISDSNRYKMGGNSVSIPVVKAIAVKLNSSIF